MWMPNFEYPTLAPVQIEARKRAAGHIGFKRGFAFFMEMGLGKTLTDLSETMAMVQAGEISRAVVFCPNSFKEGWVKEVEKWKFPFSAHVVESTGAEYWTKRFIEMRHNQPPIMIVNWEAGRSEKIQNLIRQFRAAKPSKISFDESIKAKNNKSDQTKAAIDLAKEFDFRRILCGKPMTQGPHDMWAQFRLIGALDGYDYYRFRYNFCKMGGFKGKTILGSKEGSEEKLARLIDPWCFKAEKSLWMPGMPPKVYTTRNYSLGPTLQGHFDEMLNDFVTFLSGVDENDYVAVDAAITKYIKLAQIQRGFIIDDKGAVRQLVSDDKNPCLNELQTFMEDELTGKICIVYNHIHSGNLLRRALARYQPATLGGGNTMRELGVDVEAEKRRYNEDPNCRAILLQTVASKYGHTLLGDQLDAVNASHTMAFFENTYSLDDRSQIEDRIHRMGQDADSCLYVDFAGTLLDARAVEALQRKESVYRAIMQYVTVR